ncbi:MAG TPA: YvcK family protein [Candidatus Wallbacteria bacterium]|nr:MAG: Gluconeogenesis factor [bacterium ADurb.Bin243]HOD40862.1 YvcK family protein [Candidatus Wallbacteria bacterium]HPG58065.1 YvcK family protein [Candidatus Wallbacteria bacterium]
MISKWLIGGLGIKRWILALGISVFTLGVCCGRLCREAEIDRFYYMALAAFFSLVGTVSLIKIILFVEKIIKIAQSGHIDDYFHDVKARRRPAVMPPIVMIGGGTGLSTMLRGVREYSGDSKNLAAIVTVADDGGSSGRLRGEMNILPPGDIRNCLIALSTEEPLLTKLFQYRFKDNTELGGHSFGNLFIAALTHVTGDFVKAVKESSKILAVSGKVLPSTDVALNLKAVYEDGSVVIGESQIAYNALNKKIRSIAIEPEGAEALPEAVSEIEKAKVIIIGPGSLYTSLMPNLLIGGIKDAIIKSAALKIYICNVMTQPGETDNYSAYDHLKVITSILGERSIDYIVVSDVTNASDVLLAKYRASRAEPVKIDIEKIAALGVKIVRSDLSAASDFLRHDPDKLAKCILDIVKHKMPA